ncbi:hypothetical protein KBH13_08495 [Myxococcota bacterium]|nr:hypothetical protein [Myxococcota bacterium]
MKTRFYCLFVLFAATFLVNCSVEAAPYEVDIIVDGRPLLEYLHKGQTWVEGQKGARYEILVKNNTDRRIEVVASVDGLDVIDGLAGDFTKKRGYVVAPYGKVIIDGFRISMQEVAAFRFSAVADSYAAKTSGARNVGVIGVAVFTEKKVEVPKPQRIVAERSASPKRAPAGAARYGSAGFNAKSAPSHDMMLPESTVPSHDMMLPESTARPGLGTEFGENRSSSVVNTRFVRANPKNPTKILTVRYNDYEGLVAQGVIKKHKPSETWLRETANPFPDSARRFAKPPRD